MQRVADSGGFGAHAEAFGDVKPANTTYYVGRLIPDGALVEVEIDAAV